ncbi:MAG TPA: PepSY domain-containing protein [Lamprocystis sp. (in: g-proteobacteria)]|nr:PepSY domain-containing protein [Lamprocystis sp. (in: g-proteobacteria)]
MQTRHTRLILSLAMLLTAGWSAAHDHNRDWEDDDHSYDRARRANQRGEILDLAEIYRRAAAQVPGRVLEAELEKEHGRWVYELQILDPSGRLRELKLDARTGKIFKQEGD